MVRDRRVAGVMRRDRLALAAAVAVAIGVLVWLVSGAAREEGGGGAGQGAAMVEPAAGGGLGARAGGRARVASQEALRLEGQVIDGDERPVGGATVVVDGSVERRAVTEADGSFALDGLPAATYRVTARRDGRYAPMVLVRLRADTEPVILRMRRGMTLAITVVDEEAGAPIAGARVTGRGDQAAVTGRDGVAELHGVEPWFAAIYAEADGYAAGMTSLSLPDDPGGRYERTIALERGAPLSGTVVDAAGDTVAEAWVEIDGPTPGGNVETDAAGAWRWPGLAAGTYTIVAGARGHGPSATLTVELDGRTPRDLGALRLTAGARVAGVVVDEAGAAVGGARVEALGGARGAGPATAVTSADGRFELTGLARASYAVIAFAGDLASEQVMVDASAATRDEVRLVLAPATIEGVVVTTAGAPVPEAQILTRGEGVRWNGEAVADSAGRFVVGPLPRGDYEIEAMPAGWGFADVRPSHGSGNRARARTGARDVTLTLPAVGAITGQVLLDGAPVPAYGLAISDFEAGLLSFATPIGIRSDDGRFRREGVPEGTWILAIFGDDFARRIIGDVEVEAGKVTDLGRITVDHGHTIRGRVVDARGAAVAGATVRAAAFFVRGFAESFRDDSALRARQMGHYEAVSGADGRFTIPNVSVERRLVVIAEHPSRGRSPEVRVAPDEEVTIALEPVGALDGVVVGARGQAHVEASRVGTREVERASIDAGGRFRLDGLVPGTYRVVASELMARTSAPVEVEVRADQRASVTLAFVRGVTLAVHRGDRACTLVMLNHPGADGAPTNPAWLAPCDGPPAVFADLAPGDYTVCVDATCKPVTVADAPARQELDVTGW